MTEPDGRILLGTIIFEARIETDTVMYIALKITKLGEVARFTTHVCKDEESGKHSITFMYRLHDSDNAQLMRSKILLLLKTEMKAEYSRFMQKEGVIDWVISDDVTTP